MTTVAVLGTGTMGAGMAGALLEAGLEVRVWNRTREKAEPLAEKGAEVCDSAAEAARGADVVITMLYDADSVVEVLGDLAGALGEDAIVLQTATVGHGIQGIVEAAGVHGIRLVDAPVLGTKAPAEQGALVVLAAGDPGLREPLAPVLDAIGSRTIWVGEEPGPGSMLKLACNAWVASLTAATAQSIAIAQALGLDPDLFLEAIEGGAVDSQYAHLKGEAMIAGAADAPVSFQLDGVRKDLGLITRAAAGAGVATELLDGLNAVFDRASAAGAGRQDMAGVRRGFDA